jgi:hypothetical protein
MYVYFIYLSEQIDKSVSPWVRPWPRLSWSPAPRSSPLSGISPRSRCNTQPTFRWRKLDLKNKNDCIFLEHFLEWGRKAKSYTIAEKNMIIVFLFLLLVVSDGFPAITWLINDYLSTQVQKLDEFRLVVSIFKGQLSRV